MGPGTRQDNDTYSVTKGKWIRENTSDASGR